MKTTALPTINLENKATMDTLLNTLIDFLRSLRRRRTLAEIAEAELIEAQRRKLEAETALEFARSAVDQHNATITRLRRVLQDKILVERGSLT